jgi:pyruvate kinase
MILPANKTKIVCTIGPACSAPEVMERMIRAGMNVARLNFSHGDFAGHAQVIADLRVAASATGRRLAIMGDLPGPKMRIGQIAGEPVELKNGATFTLTTNDVVGDAGRASVTFSRLPQAVTRGDILFLNDGVIQLEVESVAAPNVNCRVVVGGELRSRKGLNLPGIDLGISAFTEHDRECLAFAAEQSLDAVSQSFVESAADIEAVRGAAAALGYRPFVIAKIERSRARDNLDGILRAADGIMIARGDLGVEIPIEKIALAQKYLVRLANLAGKPVITATQMLESMTTNRRPTRAEATDVANAVLDGSDCVMLSAESAMGRYPVEAVEMLAHIAADIEVLRPAHAAREALRASHQEGEASLTDLIAFSVDNALERIDPAVVIVPTHGGYSARRLARLRPEAWIAAVSTQESTCQQLQFSYGVHPIHESEHPDDWTAYARTLVERLGLKRRFVVLTEGPSARRPDANNRMEIIDLGRAAESPQRV